MIKLCIDVLLDDLDELGKERFPTMADQNASVQAAYNELAAHITGADFGHRVVKAVELGDWA